MLNTYLKSTPSSKFILINDCVQEKGLPLVYSISEHHQKLNKEVKCFVCEGYFDKIKAILISHNINSYDCTRNKGMSFEDVEKAFKAELTRNGVIVIDSLVHLTYLYGLVRTYKLLNSLMQKMKDGQQIIAILHMDLSENSKKISQYLEHLATLTLTFKPALSRVNYTYKKAGGRVFKQIEAYRFEDGQFVTEELKKQDLRNLLGEKTDEISPENLTTFKIGLSEAEKESRDNLTLPYLPKDEDSTEDINYNFEKDDDWDEEDPDDDLDL